MNLFRKRKKSYFGEAPRATPEQYGGLWEEARQRKHPILDDYMVTFGAHEIDREWLDNLALHTQVVIKKSRLNWQHGRLLYALLSARISDPHEANQSFTVLETGTARGFSAMVMAKCIHDHGKCGQVISIDVIPHNEPMYWNCIDDASGKNTREQLLQPWHKELRNTVFLTGQTTDVLSRLGVARIQFAFLDAQHTRDAVLSEYDYVSSRQYGGDLIVFDDVTPGSFDGIVEAVELIEKKGNYNITRVQTDEQRGYAIATKL